MLRFLAGLLTLLAFAAACTAGEDESATPEATTTAAGTAPVTPPTTAEPLTAPPVGPPLERFVRAARRGNAQAMWDLLSQRTQRRFGPTFEDFRNGVAKELEKSVGSFVRGRSGLFLTEQINLEFAVAAFGGRRLVGGQERFGAYGAALRLEENRWKLEFGGPVLLEAVSPDPGKVENRSAQLALGIAADSAVLEGGMWLDGRTMPGRTGGTDERNITLYTDSVPDLTVGPHAVVGFAATSDDASALAWLFTVR